MFVIDPGGPTPPGIYTTPIKGGGAPTMLVRGSTPSTEAAWSPDSTRIAFTAGPSPQGGTLPGIQIASAVGGASKARVIDTPQHAVDSSPSWAPDGASVLVERDLDQGHDPRFIAVNVDTPGERQVLSLTPPDNGYAPRWGGLASSRTVIPPDGGDATKATAVPSADTPLPPACSGDPDYSAGVQLAQASLDDVTGGYAQIKLLAARNNPRVASGFFTTLGASGTAILLSNSVQWDLNDRDPAFGPVAYGPRFWDLAVQLTAAYGDANCPLPSGYENPIFGLNSLAQGWVAAVSANTPATLRLLAYAYGMPSDFDRAFLPLDELGNRESPFALAARRDRLMHNVASMLWNAYDSSDWRGVDVSLEITTSQHNVMRQKIVRDLADFFAVDTRDFVATAPPLGSGLPFDLSRVYPSRLHQSWDSVERILWTIATNPDKLGFARLRSTVGGWVSDNRPTHLVAPPGSPAWKSDETFINWAMATGSLVGLTGVALDVQLWQQRANKVQQLSLETALVRMTLGQLTSVPKIVQNAVATLITHAVSQAANISNLSDFREEVDTLRRQHYLAGDFGIVANLADLGLISGHDLKAAAEENPRVQVSIALTGLAKKYPGLQDAFNATLAGIEALDVAVACDLGTCFD